MRKLLAIAIVALLLAPTAGCGDDGGGDDNGRGAPAAEADDDGGSGGSDAATGDRAVASEAFCARAGELAADRSLDDLDVSEPDDAELAASILQGFAGLAPEAIAGDIELLADTYPALAVAFAEAAADPDADEADFAELEADFAAVGDASRRMEAFVLDACGVDFGD